MYPNKPFGIGFLVFAVALASSVALAAPALLSTDYRYAAQADKTFVRGGGTVSESKLLPRGQRFAAPAAAQEGKGQAVATAVYLFKVPLAAKGFTIEVGYRVDAAAKDKEVAGLLFVRNQVIEEQAAAALKETKRSLEEDPAFFGNLYFLKGGETTASVTLPAENHIINGVLEVHLTAGAGQAFDAQYVQVAAHRSAAPYPVMMSGPGGYSTDPLRQPQSPRYFYDVPNLYPNLYGAGQASSQDPIFWHQLWLQQRPNAYYPYPYPSSHDRGHRRK
ncbi:MAG TPA: hypothetical protein VNE39_00345 [Planctomycetota bacterium]|nr:hypothetical protein [Planctomycetota bacterium]